MTKDNHRDQIDSENNRPLVSVICRTTQRPELSEALQSVKAQTYSNIELVLVNALADGPIAIPQQFAALDIKQVGAGEPLARADAANMGLEAASGDYLLFLDDDDWIAADHILSLVEALDSTANLAAYSNTRRVSPTGELREEVFDRDFDRAVLMRDNFLPIHAVLFSRKLLEEGCRFDPTLNIYEDWDFWLQVAQFTDFTHLDATTAFYRDGGRSGTEVATLMQKYEPGHPNALAREQVLEKWLSRWKGSDINRMLGTMVRFDVIEDLDKNLTATRAAMESQSAEILSLRAHAENLVEENAALQKDIESQRENLRKTVLQLQAANRSTERLRQEVADKEAQYKHLEFEHQALQRHFHAVITSFSWRITKPYRFISLRLKRYVFNPCRHLLNKLSGGGNSLPDSARVATPSEDGEPDSEPREILFNLDTPDSDGKLVSENLSLHGWAHSTTGPVDVAVSVDGKEYSHFVPSLPRPDVQQLFPEASDAGNCGFSETLSLRYLSSGQHQLQLSFTSRSGATEIFECSFLLYRHEELYNAWLDYRSDIFRRDEAMTHIGFEQAPLHIIFVAGSDVTQNHCALESLAQQQKAEFRLLYVGADWQVTLSRIDARAGDKLDKVCRVQDSLADALAYVASQPGWTMSLAPGCCLSAFALQRLLSKAAEADADLVYSDHDTMDADALHSEPVFTFGWSPEHLISSNYVGTVFLTSNREITKHLNSLHPPGWEYRLLLRMAFASPRVERVPDVLWSSLPLEAESEMARLQEEEEAITDLLVDQQVPAALELTAGVRGLKWQLPAESGARVSVIIPTMGKLQLIRPCIESLLRKTNYPDYEVIILDNSRGQNPEGIEWLREQDFKVIECNEAFNWSRLNNIGAQAASGDLLLFLNDDIEILQSDWLEELARQALRPEIGAVGCKLLYPNGMLQHAGVILVNHGGGCAHLFHKLHPNRHIYQRLDRCVRETSGVTGACLMVKRELFDELNGFDEELAVVGNDIDFCLRLRERGSRNLWTPRCTLIHHESISREARVPPEDEQVMWKRWGKLFIAGDQYYNPNLSQTFWDCRQQFDVPASELLVRLSERETQQADHLSDAQAERQFQPGVNLIGYIRADMGVGEGARSDARALEAAGIDFGIINFESGNPASMTNTQWQSKEILNAPFDINLIHVNGNFLAAVFDELPAHFIKGRYNIAYWAWELEELPDDWLPQLQLVDEIWVPSDFVRAAVEKVSTIPVVTIPHNVALLPSFAFARAHFAIPEDSFTFLAMYDTNSIAERKNPRAVLAAFQSAFSGDDMSVCLALKLNNATEEAVSELEELTEGYSNIVILKGAHSRQEIDSLLTQVDCFVSLHRSEGFGLGPLEAMSLGKPCILTNWSGNTDYMTADNCLAVDYTLIPLERDFGPYQQGQRWADADVEQAASYMQKLATNPEFAERVGQQAKRSVEQHFSPRAVGEQLARRLASIRDLRQSAE